MKTYGTLDNPFPELPPAASFYSVAWAGTVVIAELPEQFAFLESVDPAIPAYPEATGAYATAVEIPKADWKDYWTFEALSPTELFAAPDGAGYYRYYVTFSSQLAPKGDIAGYADYDLANNSLGNSSGETPYGTPLVVIFENGGSGTITDYYDGLSDYDQPLHDFVSRPSDAPGDGTTLRRYGFFLEIAGFSAYQVGLTGDGANALASVNTHDESWTYDVLVNMAKTKEVALYQNDTNFQNGHAPAPAVKLSAYTWTQFMVDATTKRLVPFVLPPEGGGAIPDPPTPKWTRTIPLTSWPPTRLGPTLLGRFNSRGFALGSAPLP